MDMHLIDGTYELFRYLFAVPAAVGVNAPGKTAQYVAS
jgi:hypothetical protein